MADRHPLSKLAIQNRYPYSPITERADYAWPDGRRLAVYIAINLEQYSFGEGLREELVGGGHEPDVLNYSWRDYGNRVAIWRLKALFDEFRLPITLPRSVTFMPFSSIRWRTSSPGPRGPSSACLRFC